MSYRKIGLFLLFPILLICLTGSAVGLPLLSFDRVWIRLEPGFYESLNKLPFGPIEYPTGNAQFDAIMSKYGVTRLEPLYMHDPKSLADPVFQRLGMAREYRFICPLTYGEIDPIHLSHELKSISVIENAEPIPRRDLEYTPSDWALSGRDSWGIDSCHARQAWDVQRGDSTILAVTIDTGVNYNHPDLFPNIATNTREDLNHDGRFTSADSNGIDNDTNGFVDDVIGYNFVSHTLSTGDTAAVGEQYGTRNNKPLDVHGHGTHVCGSIAARTDNATGVAAASFNVKTICVRAGFAWIYRGQLAGSGYDDDFIAAIQYAVNRGARIISISFGGTSSSTPYQTAITYARNHNCLVMAAAGNSNTNTLFYPAAYTGVMAVAALDRGNVRASFSNYGTWVDIAAPGVSIWSTMVNNTYHAVDYAAWSGTSMACPTAASAAALVLSRRPTMTSDTLEAILRRTAKNINAQNPTYVGMLGAGLINADSAVRSIPATVFSITIGGNTSPASYSFGSVNIGSTGRVPVVISNPGSLALTISASAFIPSGVGYTWSQALPATIPGNGSINDTLIFTPTTTGLVTDTLRITHNATGSPYRCLLSGTGTISITVTRPNGGEAFVIGRTDTIRFTSTSAPQGLDIEVNRTYPTGTWERLATQISSTLTSWLWNPVAGAASTTARIRILAHGLSGGDSSNANFSVVQPSITVLRPNGGETYVLGSVDTIRWSSQYLTGNARIQINRSYPTGTWDSIATVGIAASPYLWQVAGMATSNARIRILSSVLPAIGDSSNANFAVVQPILAVSQNTLTFPGTTGSLRDSAWYNYIIGDTIRITTNRTWCTVTPASGVNRLGFTVTVSANTDTLVRTCSLRVTASRAANNPLTIMVTQAGRTVVTTLALTRRNWSPASSASQFVDTVTIGGDHAGAAWSLASNATWLTFTPTGRNGTGSFTASVTANTDTLPRTARIVVTGTGTTPWTDTLLVTQSGRPVLTTLTLVQRSWSTGFGAAQLIDTITIGGDHRGAAWSLASNATWLTFTPAGRNGTGTFTASVTANPDTLSRTARIIVTGIGTTPTTDTLTVTQTAGVLLRLNRTTWNTASDSTTLIDSLYLIGSNRITWNASSSDTSWLTVTPTTGTTRAALRLTVRRNPTSNSRSARIVVAAPGSINDSVRVIVTQTGSTGLTEPFTSVPHEFAIEKMYPNPFNASMTVEIAVPKVSAVNLNIYNIVGQKVLDIQNGVMTPGRHKFTVHSTHLTSGVYLLRMSAQGYNRAYKICILQ